MTSFAFFLLLAVQRNAVLGRRSIISSFELSAFPVLFFEEHRNPIMTAKIFDSMDKATAESHSPSKFLSWLMWHSYNISPTEVFSNIFAFSSFVILKIFRPLWAFEKLRARLARATSFAVLSSSISNRAFTGREEMICRYIFAINGTTVLTLHQILLLKYCIFLGPSSEKRSLENFPTIPSLHCSFSSLLPLD